MKECWRTFSVDVRHEVRSKNLADMPRCVTADSV